MGSNLLTIIRYIDASVDFSGTIGIEEVEDLFGLYPVKEDEKNVVFKRLEDLKAEIIYTDEIFKSKLFKLYSYIDANKEITNTELETWAKSESINNYMKKKVIEGLIDCGYKIILDNYINIKVDKVG